MKPDLTLERASSARNTTEARSTQWQMYPETPPRKYLLYFDSNVYAFIQARREAREVRKLLRRSAGLMVTDAHLIEAYRIPDYALKVGRRRLIVELYPIRSEQGSYLDALELRSEIGRLTSWSQERPDTSSVESYLEIHRESWELARSNPGFHVQVGDFDDAVGRGVSEVVRMHKQSRKSNRDYPKGKPITEEEAHNLKTADDYWREQCSAVWSKALFGHDPTMRDYYDFLAPFVDAAAIRRAEWERFWKTVDSDRVPRNRLQGLVDFFQQMHKPGAGNSLDQQHALGLLYADHFLTCDAEFFRVMTYLEDFFPNLAARSLLDRSARSAVDEIEAALSS